MKLLGRQVIIRGQCNMCGECCKKVSLDIDGKWVRSIKRFEKLIDENPEYKRFVNIGQDNQGYLEFRCSWLRSNGLCKDHDHCLDICTSYPDIELYFTNGTLFDHCGYAFEEVPIFKRLLKKKIRRHSPAKHELEDE